MPQMLHFEVPLSPVIAPKKARPSDTVSDEVAGLGLQCSDYHRQMVLGHVCGAVSLKSTETSGCEQSSCPASGPLCPALPPTSQPLYVLHLLYEELKMDEERGSGGAGRRSLVGLLQQLARDLQLEKCINLYWRDYPSFNTMFKGTCIINHGKRQITSSTGPDDASKLPEGGASLCSAGSAAF
ncbi:hypothetical protein J4Q44_G00360720 [Coregonus suidteri]|uniref:Anaphase-promoting complex subunit 1 middle domain-containing protein n=1 Tax=Coregonus suidteri TaxID=861788 RepID=A0AAN8KRP5_9TELE